MDNESLTEIANNIIAIMPGRTIERQAIVCALMGLKLAGYKIVKKDV